MFNSGVDGNKFTGLETSYGGDVDHYTAFLVVVLSHILEGKEQSADYSILEKSIKMHRVRNFECEWWGRGLNIMCQVIYIFIFTFLKI
jgi:hypothetical protein